MSQAVISRPASVLSVGSKPGVPNLPEIQHPLSRLGNPDKLNIRGLSSSQGGRPMSNTVGEPQVSNFAPRLSMSAGFGSGDAARRSLPRIPRPFSNIPEGVEVKEAEDQTKTRLPVFGSRADIASRAENRAVSVASRMSRPETRVRLECDEIEMILREKLKKSYFELRKLFISNDPEGRGIVSRDALNRILIMFAGRFISTKQFNHILARLRLHDKQVIKLEEFYACFKEQVIQDVMPAWMDPVNRGPAEKVAMTATQVHAQLKEKARQRFMDVAEMIPQMNPGGTGRILKPELRNVLNKMLFFMDDDEFEKLWNRYDTEKLGVIKGERLMNKLGISLRTQTAMPEEAAYRQGAGSPELSPRTSPRRSGRRLDIERAKSMDVERWLKEKFRQGFHKMKKDFEKHDVEKKGEIDLTKFRDVLERYDLKLDKQQLDAFLARCNLSVHPKSRAVSYFDFLQRFQDRSDTGLPHKILLNPEHMYNRSIRADSPGAASNVTAAEAKMMGLFQAEFLSLLGSFHKIDKLRTNVISQQEFRAVITSRFNVEMSDEEYTMFVDRLPLDEEGNVKYAEFMADFDTRGGVAPSLFDAKSVYNRSSSPEGAAMDVGQSGVRNSFEEPMEFDDFQKGRPLKEISSFVKKLLQDRFADVEEAFRELDEQNTKHMSQETMYRMFKKVGVRPEITRGEIRRLWDTFIISQNRTYSFLEFVRHFGYSMKSASFPNAKLSPPKRGDSDFLIRSRKLNCAADMLEDNLRSKVDYMWDDLRKEFLGLDVYGTGFVSKEEFRDVLQELCVHLNQYELQALCNRFEIKHDGRVSYIEFLKPFALRKQTHRYGNNMLNLLTHPQAEVPIAPIVNEPVKGLSGITARLRQRLVGDWRTLRRAFKKIDMGHTGYLTLPEFRNVLRLCSMVLDEDEVYHVMSEFDEKMDGKINYNKFLSETFNADVKAP
ncbi:EF-hand calcium-binding domain-containing protein 6-like [Asterias rubens]|uniref:EF-hand calcium-binding domain-containing protein 6-like n=1 Tax=Asterias rubens TaxID=7604 RepID=UPI001454F391|nr:EF-hand calcium-binding domain-containing protein 6-like [Asterias rubens]